MHPFVDGNKRTALQATKQYLNFNERVLVFPSSTVAFVYKIASNTKNDPDSNEQLVNDIRNWIDAFSASLNLKGRSRAWVIIQLYYQLPIYLIQFSNKIHFTKLGDWILKTYLGMSKTDLNEDMFVFVLNLLQKQFENVGLSKE